MGFVTSVMGGLAAGSQYDAKKRQARISGEAAQNEAYARATAEEVAGKKRQHVVAENMERAAGNRRRDMAAARVAEGRSGFTGEGTGDRAEELVSRAYGQKMADVARAGSAEAVGAVERGVGLRRGGDMARAAAEVEAKQYGAMAKASRTGAWLSALGGVAGGVLGGMRGYAQAKAYNEANAEAIQAGRLQAMDVWDVAGWGGIAGTDAGAGLMASANPFVAGYAGNTWDGRLMELLGVGRIPQVPVQQQVGNGKK